VREGARAREIVHERTHVLSLRHTAHEQCGTSHVNLWGHWDSPKTACRPPSHSGDGITPSDDDAQARESLSEHAKTQLSENDVKVQQLVEISGVPKVKAMTALECANFDLIEALSYLQGA
jgi:NACalpha-BTF3-like transcription factor